jgi:hypothetical protein
VTHQDSQALAKALSSLDWHAVLHQLRICASQIPVLEQATIRSNARTQLGLPKVAGVFTEFARELQQELVP